MNRSDQEKAFRNNPWKFSKSVCDEPPNSAPIFSCETCFQYFKDTHSDDNVSYTNLPDWVTHVMPSPDEIETEGSPFDMSPITPGQVKRILQKYSTSSSLGPNKITYLHLRKLPCTHHFMATLILLSKSHCSSILVFSRNYSHPKRG